MHILFKVFSPLGVLIDKPVVKIDFEAIDGFFTLLPKHADFVSALKTGIVSYTTTDNKTAYIACEDGVVIKKDKSVSLTTKLGILDDDLERLTQTVATNFKEMEEIRKEANKAIAQLELNLVKGFLYAKKQEDII